MRTDIDQRASRLVAAVSAAAGDLRATRPDARALGDLYLRVREQLQELDATAAPAATAESLALTVYLAWLAEDGAPGPDQLVRLKTRIEEALRETSEEAEPC